MIHTRMRYVYAWIRIPIKDFFMFAEIACIPPR